MSGFARRLQQGVNQSQLLGVTLAQDNFNRSNGSLGTADIGGTWSTFGTPSWEITGDTANLTASGGTNAVAVATLPISMMQGTAVCDMYLSPNSANTGLCLRANGSTLTYLNIQLNKSSAYDRIAISKAVNGSTTWLSSEVPAGLVYGTGYTLAAVLTASTITVYVDGVQQLSYAFTAQDLTDLAGNTNVGLRSWFGPTDDDGNSQWDRFLVTSSTSVPAARVPAAPWNVTAANGGSGQATISWSRAGNGGSALTGYIISSSDSGHNFTVADPAATSYLATGLNNVAQTFTVQAVNAVGNSAGSVSGSVTPATASVPGAPTGAAATAGNTSATVTFTAPASNGGSAITGYTATSSPGGFTGSVSGSAATPIIVNGLTNGTPYTFTVHATNSVGNSVESTASNSVTPAATTVPGAPTSVSATASNASATVTFTAPASNGGSTITGYTATSSPGGFTGSISGSAAAPIMVTGLTNGTSYTFTVTATNAVGTGSASSPSNSVTPSAPSGNNYLLSPSTYGYPDASNTGPAGTLTASGSVTTSSNGQIIQNLDISGNIVIKHPNVTIKNCRVTYSSASTSGRAIDATFQVGDTGTLTIQDCDIICTQGNQAALYLQHQNVQILRCNISGAQDGIDIATYTGDVTVQDSYIHDLIRASGSHDDCIQPFNAGDITISHNTLMAFTGAPVGSYPGQGDPMNSVMQIGQLNDPVGSITFTDNLCDGGNYTLNANTTGSGCGPISIQNNRFGRDCQYGINAIGFSYTWSGNVYDNDGSTA